MVEIYLSDIKKLNKDYKDYLNQLTPKRRENVSTIIFRRIGFGA